MARRERFEGLQWEGERCSMVKVVGREGQRTEWLR